MFDEIALCLGYAVMSTGGAAIAIAIAWAAAEYLFKKYHDFALLREFLIWRKNKDRVVG